MTEQDGYIRSLLAPHLQRVGGLPVSERVDLMFDLVRPGLRYYSGVGVGLESLCASFIAIGHLPGGKVEAQELQRVLRNKLDHITRAGELNHAEKTIPVERKPTSTSFAALARDTATPKETLRIAFRATLEDRQQMRQEGKVLQEFITKYPCCADVDFILLELALLMRNDDPKARWGKVSAAIYQALGVPTFRGALASLAKSAKIKGKNPEETLLKLRLNPATSEKHPILCTEPNRITCDGTTISLSSCEDAEAPLVLIGVYYSFGYEVPEKVRSALGVFFSLLDLPNPGNLHASNASFCVEVRKALQQQQEQQVL